MSYNLEIVIVGIMATFLYLLQRYMQGGSCRSQVKLHGKTVIITGGNTGIGKETAIDLAKRGARVILACRSQSKGDNAVKDIIQASSNKNVVFRSLDLASFKSIKQFAANIHKNEERLDILINNAGVLMCPYTETEDGYEMQFATNHLGHFLLTHLLLNKLKVCAPSRIVVVSSIVHFYGKIDFDNLLGKKKYKPFAAYTQSKLANVLFAYELAKRLRGTGVTANSLHPGVVNTNIARHFSLLKNKMIRATLLFFLWPIHKTPQNGAQTSIYCAVDPSLNNVSGRYFTDCCQKKCAEQGCDDGVARKLWEISEEMVGLTKSGH